MLFPQLLLVLYWNEYCNSYGCIASFSTGFLFRVLGNNSIVNKTKLLFSNGRLGCQIFIGGEPLIGLPVILPYPFYDRHLGQLFPFRTMSMIISLLSHVIVSLAARWIFMNRRLPARWDLLRCFQHQSGCTVAIPAAACIPTITLSHYSCEPRRKAQDLNSEHFKMGRIPRPKLKKSTPYGVHRRDMVPGYVQREPPGY